MKQGTRQKIVLSLGSSQSKGVTNHWQLWPSTVMKAHREENKLNPGATEGFLKKWPLNHSIKELVRWTFQLNLNVSRKNTDWESNYKYSGHTQFLHWLLSYWGGHFNFQGLIWNVQARGRHLMNAFPAQDSHFKSRHLPSAGLHYLLSLTRLVSPNSLWHIVAGFIFLKLCFMSLLCLQDI